MMRSSNVISVIKVLLLGPAGSGKTAITVKYTDKSFSADYNYTIGVDFRIKTITLNNDSYKLQIWDTAGDERFRTIVNAYIRGAYACVLVVDVTQDYNNQFNSVLSHANDIINLAGKDNLPFVYLAANKTDVPFLTAEQLKELQKKNQGAHIQQRKITDDQLKKLQKAIADQLNKKQEAIPLVPCSAKNGTNITELFTQVATDHAAKLAKSENDELITALNTYKDNRNERGQGKYLTTFSLFCGMKLNFGFSKTVKFSAVDKLIRQLQNPAAIETLNKTEFNALYNGQLKKVINQYEKQGYKVKAIICDMYYGRHVKQSSQSPKIVARGNYI